MAWQIILERKARKALARFPVADSERLLAAINQLAVDPYAARSIKALKGRDEYRLRVGDYRVVYKLEDDKLIVFVIEISQRGGADR